MNTLFTLTHQIKPFKKLNFYGGSIILLFIILQLLPTTSFAQTKDWIGNTGNWADPNGWSPVGVPVATDDVIIDAGDDVRVPPAYSAFAKSIFISNGGIVSTNATAVVEFNGSSREGLTTAGFGSQFSNAGTLRIGNSAAIVFNGITVLAGSSFSNTSGGLIEIDRTGANGINPILCFSKCT